MKKPHKTPAGTKKGLPGRSISLGAWAGMILGVALGNLRTGMGLGAHIGRIHGSLYPDRGF